MVSVSTTYLFDNFDRVRSFVSADIYRWKTVKRKDWVRHCLSLFYLFVCD